MKSAAKEEIRARCNQKIDLRAITGEQAVYAVLDRAMLWGELNNSWYLNIVRGLVYVITPALTISGVVWLFHAPLWARFIPLVLGSVLLGGMWLRDLLNLAHEGREARIVASMTRAVADPTPSPRATAVPRCATGTHVMKPTEDGLFCSACGIADYQLEDGK